MKKALSWVAVNACTFNELETLEAIPIISSRTPSVSMASSMMPVLVWARMTSPSACTACMTGSPARLVSERIVPSCSTMTTFPPAFSLVHVWLPTVPSPSCETMRAYPLPSEATSSASAPPLTSTLTSHTHVDWAAICMSIGAS